LLNFVALLGWNPKDGREVLSVDEMAHAFELNHVHSSPATVDMKKLNV